ncbi:GcvT family protein [Amycolatopsis samaneae]|uniref:FAD-dependent oxidoreductase n=1 Tax=Amycolatopsis samaneae TaxID=664691 RepID=A0ABW5GNB2_9PSEU
MAARPRVVVVGAGIVGCALADELTERGWTDVTVLERGELSGAPVPPAPGLVFRTHRHKTMTEFARYTAEKYHGLTLDGRRCFRDVGGLEVATTPARWADLRRRHGWATSWGVPGTLLDADACAALHPLLDAGKVLGGFHTPGDGLADSRRAAEVQARRATGRGARFLGGHRVTGVERSGGRVTAVVTGGGRFRADVVVSCAGLWGPLLGDLVGLTVPLVPMARQYARTTPLAALSGAAPPILRHQDAGLSFRTHGNRLGVGAHGHQPPLSGLTFTPDDFGPSWAAAAELLPPLRGAEVAEGVNVLVPFTPDGLPLLGEHPDLDGFWVAEAVEVAHSAGVARALAEWLVDGQPRTDVHACDLARFEPVQLAPEYVHARSRQSFAEVYDIIHPAQPGDGPRPLRTSPFHERQAELGAHFREADGWARPQWYAGNADLPEVGKIPDRNEWAARYWSPIGGAEALVARERVALFDLTPSKRLEVTGPGALPFLQAMTTNQLDRPPGTITYTLLLGEDGGVRGDLTVARLAADRFHAGVNGPLDLAWLRGHLPGDGTVQIHETTPGTCCVGLWGPLAKRVLQPLSTLDFAHHVMGRHEARFTYVGGVPVLAMRQSSVGGPGWELHTGADLGRRLWDALWEAGAPHGIIAAGREAFTSMRVERGYRTWGTDMTTEHDPYEAGLGFAVRADKGYFLGRDALEGRSAATVTRRLTRLLVGDPHAVVLGDEPVYAGGRPAGYVTSAAYGYTTGENLAYAWLPVAHTKPGTPVEIEYFAERVPAVVVAEPSDGPAGRG